MEGAGGGGGKGGGQGDMGVVTCNELAFHAGGVALLSVALCSSENVKHH